MTQAKSLLSVLLLAVLGCATSFAQQSPSDISDKQIKTYQDGMQEGCVIRGRERGDTSEYVESFCACMLETLLENVTRDEWQTAYIAATRGNRQAEQQAISKHLPKLQACKRGAA